MQAAISSSNAIFAGKAKTDGLIWPNNTAKTSQRPETEKPYMSEVRRRVAEKNIFDDNGEYVRACKYKKASTALGAAIYQIEKFISSV